MTTYRRPDLAQPHGPTKPRPWALQLDAQM